MPPDGVYLMALLIRLSTTCTRRSPSPAISGIDGRVDFQFDAFFLGDDHEPLSDRVRQLTEIDRGGFHREPPGLQTRQIGQFEHHAVEALGFLVDDARRLAGIADAVHDRLRVALNRGQRRLEVVRDVGEKILLRALLGADFVAHAVERLRDGAHFFRPADRHGLVVMPVGDLGGGFGDGLQRAGDAARDQNRQQHGDHQPDDRRLHQQRKQLRAELRERILQGLSGRGIGKEQGEGILALAQAFEADEQPVTLVIPDRNEPRMASMPVNRLRVIATGMS